MLQEESSTSSLQSQPVRSGSVKLDSIVREDGQPVAEPEGSKRTGTKKSKRLIIIAVVVVCIVTVLGLGLGLGLYFGLRVRRHSSEPEPPQPTADTDSGQHNSKHGSGGKASVDLGYAKYEGNHLSNSISEFVGIRYARPPTGDLRWRAPVDPKDEDGVQSAQQVSFSCRSLSYRINPLTVTPN